ncbi:MAG: dienelactone hydrolase family protein [Gemmatimonadetes bacterium]|nr:dienelactone hydrolase family protein [Gemmatimonadota bacterium]
MARQHMTRWLAWVVHVVLAAAAIAGLSAGVGAQDPAAASPRHGEYVMLATASGDSLRAFVVYPEREDAAPALIVIHEIFGLTDWIRSVADRYAAEGFIAIAPDLLWGRGPGGGGTDSYPDQDAVVAAIRELPPALVKERLDAARTYLERLPAGNGRVGTVGFCWGGHQAFQYAVDQSELDATVVFYGSPPDDLERVSAIRAPVLGLYGGEDNRVNASIPDAERAMQAAGKRYEREIYAGAGHGFLRESERKANADAAARAWPRSVEFLRAALTKDAAPARAGG